SGTTLGTLDPVESIVTSACGRGRGCRSRVGRVGQPPRQSAPGGAPRQGFGGAPGAAHIMQAPAERELSGQAAAGVGSEVMRNPSAQVIRRRKITAIGARGDRPG